MANPGQRVSEYVLEDRLGSGAFGEVWRARHHAWHGTVVAVKLSRDGGLIRQLQREGGVVQGLDHPNVVRPLGFDASADPPYLIGEYVGGGNLRGPIERRELTPARTVDILRDVLAGLAYAHERGIVHRDLKPENVLLTEAGRAKVADFGLGQTSAATAASAVYSLSLDDDASRRVVGTLDYMSPEQRAGGAVDARADLFAVAVMLFEMLTGQKPAGHDVPGDLNASVPPHLDAAFRRGYARSDRRFESAGQFSAALAAPPPAVPALPARLAPPAAAGLSPVTFHKPCARCRREVADTDQFCMHCGVQLASHVRRCGRCGAYPDPHDAYCLRCGDPIAARPPALHRIG